MTPSGVNVGGCEVFQALVIALMVVVSDERRHVILEITGQEVVFRDRPGIPPYRATDGPVTLSPERNARGAARRYG